MIPGVSGAIESCVEVTWLLMKGKVCADRVSIWGGGGVILYI
jgi:hypothetical protein